MNARKSAVLVADDDKVIRDFFKRLLTTEEVLIFLAENGARAIEIAKQNDIDLAFVDIHMPDLDGIKTYQRLKEINPNLSCVFMTGYAVEETFLEMIKHQGIIFLKKPFGDIEQIKEIVKEVLQRTKQEMEVSPDKPESIIDRRAYTRLEVTLDVSYKVKQKPQKSFIRSLSKDIAPGGIGLYVPEELMPGTILELVMKVPGYAEICEATGEVVWSKKGEAKPGYYMTGIKFLNVDLAKLTKLIAHCRKSP